MKHLLAKVLYLAIIQLLGEATVRSACTPTRSVNIFERKVPPHFTSLQIDYNTMQTNHLVAGFG